MTQAVEVLSPQQELVAQVRSEQFRSQVALALPEDVTADRFTRIAITALQANPGIAELERQSVMRALLDAAAMGLMPDNREAALVPFKGKAQLVPMIAGYRKIAAEYGWTIYTAIAYEADLFEYELGLDVRFRHVPVRPGQTRGEAIAAYAVGRHQDGRREVEVLTVEEVEKVRATSQTATRPDAPWTQWWEQMAEKTAGKRLFKKLPLSEDDKRVRIIRASVEPAEAAAAIYGPQARAALGPGERLDRETGEITPTPTSADGGSSAASSGEQAEGASPKGTESPSSPRAPSVPASDDPEPGSEPDLEPGSEPVVPGGTYAGKTIAEVAGAGEKGERWLSWALRHPESPNVGAEFHAALTAWFET